MNFCAQFGRQVLDCAPDAARALAGKCGRNTESGTGVPHSKTLARHTVPSG
jgi:hypothetical protein